MLQLIADSGSTKTLWVLLNGTTELHRCETKGINPYLLTKNDIQALIKSELSKEILKSDVQKIFFYGAGCSNAERKNEVKDAIQAVFEYSKIEIEHDMLAAARALLGTGSGVACILGTGSNSCLYLNGKIEAGLPSPGYIFGDEGGGLHIGKLLLEAYIYNELPVSLKVKLEMEYHLTYEAILENVYKKPMPNRYIASFSKFVSENTEHDFCKNLVKESFKQFLKRHVIPYKDVKNYPVAFVGSVAFYFKDLLQEVVEENNLLMGNIIKSPMEGLLLFHQ